MKKHTLLYSLLIVFVFSVFSCGKDNATPNDGFKDDLSPEIKNILADSLVLQLEELGFKIHKGNQPPQVEGTYLASPLELMASYGFNDVDPGRLFNDYWFHIYEQNGDKAKIDYVGAGLSDQAIGNGSFISGNDNKFTLFSEFQAVYNDQMDYTAVSILTGEISEHGITDFQFAFVLTSKEGDENNLIFIPEGGIRTFFDNDFLAETTDENVFDNVKVQIESSLPALLDMKLRK